MKKLIFTVGFIFTVSYFTQAQNHLEAGLRFGGGFNDNIAFDATIPIAAKPRLHPALYLNNNGVTIGTYFDWMFDVNDVPGLKVYPGVGPELYIYNEADLGVAGNFGVEYLFDFPMTVGFDWRPALVLTNGGAFRSSNWGIAVRYRFN